ncbi:MAG: cellulase family glycosylhydrolase [Kiritimatiellae bacterium]|nr:cellulase family glycosylhydrolase [Kiritimatiellia bacterium]
MRTAVVDGVRWYYALNTGFAPCAIRLPPGLRDAVTGEDIPSETALDSYELRAMTVPVQSASTSIPLGELDWQFSAEGVRREGDRIVAEIPQGVTDSVAVATAALDLAPYADHCLRLRIHAKGSGLGTPPEKWLGLKFMVRLDLASGETKWPGTQQRTGDFEDDLETTFDLEQFGPLASATLVLGLEKGDGRVEFDLSTLRADDFGILFPRTNQDYIVRYAAPAGDPPASPASILPQPPCVVAGPPHRGAEGGAANRGAMLAGKVSKITEDDFATLASWGANLVRYQMMQDYIPSGSAAEKRSDPRWLDQALYDAHLAETLGILETNILPWAAAHGMRVVVDLHQTPGGRNKRGENRMFFEERFAERYVEIWREIAARFRGDPRIYGYDLVNEPKQLGPAPFPFDALEKAAAEAIREIDPSATIVVAPNGMGQPTGFRNFSPLAMDNVVYTTHCYAPMAFTHQGLPGWPGKAEDGFRYPNPEKGWDKDAIRAALAPVADFARRHHARILVGELSAISWAQGAGDWIRDCTEVLDELGWDWCYHAFRESAVWDVEREWRGWNGKRDVYGPSPDNPRRRALTDALSR